jgi:glyceraldehyde-3-phosphate dehydrogenase (NADP+)
MKFSSLCLTFALLGAATAEEGSCSQSGLTSVEAPFVAAKMMLHGVVKDPENTVLADVTGCCAMEKMEEACSSGNFLTGSIAPQVIGQIPQMNKEQTLQVLEDAKAGWKGGSGVWPQMSLKERVETIEKFIDELRTKREEIVVTLMWEIGKNRKDAEAEFDRTLDFVQKVKEEKDRNAYKCFCGYHWSLKADVCCTFSF